MSTKIVLQTEIRDRAIICDTLKEMNLDFTEESNEILRVQHFSYPITLNTETGEMNFDSDQNNLANQIKQKYAFNFIQNECLKQGSTLQQEVDARGVIHILTH